MFVSVILECKMQLAIFMMHKFKKLLRSTALYFFQAFYALIFEYIKKMNVGFEVHVLWAL